MIRFTPFKGAVIGFVAGQCVMGLAQHGLTAEMLMACATSAVFFFWLLYEGPHQ